MLQPSQLSWEANLSFFQFEKGFFLAENMFSVSSPLFKRDLRGKGWGAECQPE